MFGQREINRLHSKLESKLRTVIQTKNARLRHPRAEQNWASIKPGGDVMFCLSYVDRVMAEQALRERGGRVDVFPLVARADDSGETHAALTGRLWVSWRERWRKGRRKTFDLLTAGWTLFHGPQRDPDKVQILRAEWDQLGSDVGDQQAGQPHWHVDHDVVLVSPTAALGVRDGDAGWEGAPVETDASLEPHRQETAGGLEELEPSVVPGSGVNIPPLKLIGTDHVHLAMGTWNVGRPNPQCWQRDMQRVDELADWSEATLLYLQAQFRSIHVFV